MTNDCHVIYWKPCIEKILERKKIRNRTMEKGLYDYIIRLNNMYSEKMPYYYNSFKRRVNVYLA